MQKLFFSFCFLSSVFAWGEEVQPFQDMIDQVDVVESQATIACSSQSQNHDSIGLKTAERITAPDGVAHGLLKKVQQTADQTNYLLDHSEEVVQNRFLPVWQKKLDGVKEDLDQKLSRLNDRSPATSFEKSEGLRDQVKQAYSQYNSMKSLGALQGIARDPALSSTVRANVKALREHKIKELQALTRIGDRVATAIQKAGTCQCRLSADGRCGNTDVIKSETERYQAIHAYKKAKAEATYEVFVQDEGAGMAK